MRRRALYRHFLSWLGEEEGERKCLDVENMCRGWIKGSKDFRKAVLEELKDRTSRLLTGAEAAEMREPRWEGGRLCSH